MNTVIFPEDVANVIQSFYLANEGDDDTTDLIVAIGAELLDIPIVKMADMVVPGDSGINVTFGDSGGSEES